ncbi:MAG: AMP-binding protein, partial [Deinococcales bacterium]
MGGRTLDATARALQLVDYRQRVAGMYRLARASDASPQERWERFRAQRDELFARHPCSPLAEDDRQRPEGVPYFPYDLAARVLATAHDAPGEPLEVALREDGVLRLARLAWLSFELYGERGISFCQGYGLTETAPFSAFLTPEWAVSKLGSAGQAPMFSDTRIVDEDNQPVAPDERGEICLKGPNIMKGYWNRPDATAAAIDSEGWFHSGDVGYLDEDGFLFICDRLKDMVISGGENVYPAEVESVLYKHEAIAEVAVIGLPDDKWGEAVTAVAALH